jgi:aspartokinase/homoserine dehydrogenase 1
MVIPPEFALIAGVNIPHLMVHKFGGTSVADASRYRQVAKIIAAEPGTRKLVVVSAMSKVTDRLIELTELARKQDETYKTKITELKAKHVEAATELRILKELGPVFDRDFSELSEILRAVWLGKSCSEATLELIAGHGELWSAQILNAYLMKLHAESGTSPRSRWLDARKVLVVRPGETGQQVVDWEVSERKFREWDRTDSGGPTPWTIVTGYVASTPEGVATTLKRNGSDYSASIFGRLSDAAGISIWSDVDGVLSADPRRVPEAVVLDEMSYNEAMELAYFGAKVIHPHTMAPALAKGIPIYARNTFNPTHPGTKIWKARPKGQRLASNAPAVKGFSTIDQVALINLEGTGMIGVPGVANRLFGALKDVGVSVIMISQASSEHSICLAVPEAQGELARSTIEKAFFGEIHHGQVQQVQLLGGCAILAAVGDDMVHAAGVSAKFFAALGKAGINVRAIAQGSSERNISVVIDAKDSTRALRAVHAGLYLSDQTLSVGIIGPGLIGNALLKQLEAQAPVLRSRFRIDLRVRAIASSSKMVLANPRIELKPLLQASTSLKSFLDKDGVATDLQAFANHVQADHLPHAVIIDCTSSEEIAGQYAEWLARGIHVITPNKKANSRDYAYYQKLREPSHRLGTHYFYEATVGAGLPVITTLRDLVRTGDQIQQIEGILSGTLSFLFNSYDGSKPFSAIVREAREKGYTEPDPRDDLSGKDVARKLIILAREMGLPLELEQIQVQSLVPAELQGVTTANEFLDKLPAFDAAMEKIRAEAAAAGEVLRYVGVVNPDGPCRVELKRYPKTHAFARIQGSDNIIAFRTQRYSSQPLIVQGPGAGPEVTAGGVFADLLRLASSLGGPA